MDQAQGKRIWDKFDEAAKTAVSPDTAALVMAMRAMAELLNSHLGAIGNVATVIAQKK